MGKRKEVDLFGNPVSHAKDPKSKIKKQHSISRAYKGFRIPSAEWVIPQVSMREMTPEQFYKDFVSVRKPCLLTEVSSAEEFASLTKWTPEYLKEHAGDVELAIEKRGSVGSSFGESAPRLPLRFGEFLDGLAQGDTLRYLTSQTEDFEGDDLPRVLAEPLRSLADDIILVPSQFQGMVPYQLNLWMGCSRTGTSSGLHHDFHDNLYVLLSGVKRFNIFSPNEAENQYIRGKIKAVLENGMVLYSNSSKVNQEGVPFGLLQEHTLELIDVCSARIDALQQTGAPVQKEYLDDITVDQQYEALFAEVVSHKVSEWLEILNMLQNSLEEDELKYTALLERTELNGVEETDEEKYPHFSQIPQPLLHNAEPKLPCNTAGCDPALLSLLSAESPACSMHIRAEYAKLRDAKKGSVLVQANQALYLPCGWFHEVTSYNLQEGGHHMALNYWFHPCGRSSKDRLVSDEPQNRPAIPYESLYWPFFWESRKDQEFK